LYGWAAFKVMRRRLLPERGSGSADLMIPGHGQGRRDAGGDLAFTLLPSGHGSANAVRAIHRPKARDFALAKINT
jgi:hypothetical protein